LLTATGDVQQELFRQAREVRKERCGDQATVRGLIEISSYCRKKCNYCAMRMDNDNLERYRMTADEILSIAEEIKEHGIQIAFLQAGEDVQCDKTLDEVIPVIKNDFGLHVLLCVGERRPEVYERWFKLGADSYILKFEASDPQLYEDTIHAPQAKRFRCLQYIKDAGMKLGTGNIVGLPGQTDEHIIDDIFFGVAQRPDFISTAPFIPNEDTPWEKESYGLINKTLNVMAIWRIMLGTPLIPTVSALEKTQAGGQKAGFDAGANVITINFTPDQRRERYAIYSKGRFVVTLDHACKTVESAGLRLPGKLTPLPLLAGA